MEQNKTALSEQQIQQIQQMAEGIRYGTLTLVFQDGRLIQLERNEKMRVPREE